MITSLLPHTSPTDHQWFVVADVHRIVNELLSDSPSCRDLDDWLKSCINDVNDKTIFTCVALLLRTERHREALIHWPMFAVKVQTFIAFDVDELDREPLLAILTGILPIKAVDTQKEREMDLIWSATMT